MTEKHDKNFINKHYKNKNGSALIKIHWDDLEQPTAFAVFDGINCVVLLFNFSLAASMLWSVYLYPLSPLWIIQKLRRYQVEKVRSLTIKMTICIS